MISVKNKKISRAYKGVEVQNKDGSFRTIDVGFDTKKGRYHEIHYNADKTQAYFGSFISEKYVLAHLDKKIEAKNTYRGFFGGHLAHKVVEYARPLAAAAMLALSMPFLQGCDRKPKAFEPKQEMSESSQIDVLKRGYKECISASEKLKTNYISATNELAQAKEKISSLENKLTTKTTPPVSKPKAPINANLYAPKANKKAETPKETREQKALALEKSEVILAPRPIITDSLTPGQITEAEKTIPAQNIRPTQNIGPARPAREASTLYNLAKGKGQSQNEYVEKDGMKYLANSPTGKAILRTKEGKKATSAELNQILDDRAQRLADSRAKQYANGDLNPINPIINYVNAAERNNPKTAKDSLKAAGKSAGSALKNVARLGTASYFPRDHSVTDNDFKFESNLGDLESSVKREWTNLKAANIPKNEDLLISTPLIYATQSFYNGPLQIAHDTANLTTVVDNFSKPAEGVLNDSLDTGKHLTHIIPNWINDKKLPPGIKQLVHAATSFSKGVTHYGSRVFSNRSHKAMDTPTEAAINAGSAAGRNAENLGGFFFKLAPWLLKDKGNKGRVEWDSDGSPGGNGTGFGSGGSVGGD